MTVSYIVKTSDKKLVRVIVANVESAPGSEVCDIVNKAGYIAISSWREEFTYTAMPSMYARVMADDVTQTIEVG